MSAVAAGQGLVLAETDAHEGPVYMPGEDALYFTTVPDARLRSSIKRLALDDGAVSVVVADAPGANGMTLDADGRRLLVCEQGSLTEDAVISRLDPATGEREVVVDSWHGLPLNSPNDVVVSRADGSIWFTDPGYGHLQGFRPAPSLADRVYRYDPASGRLAVVADSLDKPNGLAFSPDERVLYVGDSGTPHHIRALDVDDAGRLSAERLFAVIEPGYPDGIKVDAAGRLYSSSASGVQVFDPAGELVDEIAVPGAVNFTFGGPDRDVLFITNDTAIWAAVLNAKGA